MFKVSDTSTHTWSHTLAPLVNRSFNNILFRVNPSLRHALLLLIDVRNLCFVHALLHNTRNFIINRSISMSIYHTYDAIFFGNIPL